MSDDTISRRDAIAALLSAAALPLLSSCARYAGSAPGAPTSPDEARVMALLDDVANNLIRLAPEQATSLGIDIGTRAALRAMLSDRSAAGQQRIAAQLRADLDRVNAVDVSSL